MPPHILKNIWFDSDLHLVVRGMTDTGRTTVFALYHPLKPLAAFAPALALQALGIAAPKAVRLACAGTCGMWTAGMYMLLRLAGCQRLDASLLVLLALTSAASLFWFPVPEVFALGSLSIVLALCVAAWPRRGGTTLFQAVAGVLTLSVTATNWMVALIEHRRRFGWRRMWKPAIVALCTVAAIWVGQHTLFSGGTVIEESTTPWHFMFLPGDERIPYVLAGVGIHPVVIPEIGTTENELDDVVLTVQRAAGPPVGRLMARRAMVAAAAWLALLALGALEVVRRGAWSLQRVAFLALCGQVALHLFFGVEVFLYSMHFLPLLVLAASAAVLGARKRLSIALVMVVVVVGGWNNVDQLRRAMVAAGEIGAGAP